MMFFDEHLEGDRPAGQSAKRPSAAPARLATSWSRPLADLAAPRAASYGRTVPPGTPAPCPPPGTPRPQPSNPPGPGRDGAA